MEPWIPDILACHDNRMRHQPNAIHDAADGRSQLSALTNLRTLLPMMVDRQDRGSPFTLSLTDLHASNIFVDNDWNITYIIDLEFACVLPIQMTVMPSLLTHRGIDQLTDKHLEEFEAMYKEFIAAMKHVESGQQVSDQGHGTFYSQILCKAWDKGIFWYSNA